MPPIDCLVILTPPAFLDLYERQADGRFDYRIRPAQIVDGTEFIVLERGGELAGFASVNKDRTDLYIAYITTATDCRRQDVAKTLLQGAFDHAQDCRKKSVTFSEFTPMGDAYLSRQTRRLRESHPGLYVVFS